MVAPAFRGFEPFPSMGAADPRAQYGGPPNQPNTFDCDADRVILTGGALATHLVHPDVTPFSRIKRQGASQGLYSGTRNRPWLSVIIAFTVPARLTLALCGATIRPYTFDPVAPGDAIPLEDRRLALSLGYDLTFATAGRLGNIQAGLIPTSGDITENPAYPTLPAANVGFPPLPSVPNNGESTVIVTAYGATTIPQLGASPNQGAITNPNQFVLGASGGGAVQPQSQDPKQGPDDMPFTYLVNEGENVTMSVVAFGPIRIPLAFVEAVLVGYLMPKTTLDAFLQRMRPC
jgi:hypothetical protein